MYNIIKSSQQNPDLKKKLETFEFKIKPSNRAAQQPAAVSSKNMSEEQIAQSIIAQAKEQAKKIIDNAQNYSLQYMKSTAERLNAQVQASITQAEAESFSAASKKGYEEGYQKGYQEGLKQAQEEIQNRIAFLESVIEGIDSGVQDMLKKYEEDLYLLAFSIASMIVKREVQIDPDTLKGIVENAAFQCKNQGSLRINISVNNYHLFMSDECGIIKRIGNISDDVRFIADPNLSDTDCIIETPIGVIDAGIDTQLKNIRLGLIHRHK